MARFSTTINETGDTTELTIMAKKAKTKNGDEFEDAGRMDDPTDAPPEGEARDGIVEDPGAPWEQDQTFKAQESNPPPPESLDEVVAPLSDATKAEMEAGRAAIGSELPKPEHPDGGVGEGEGDGNDTPPARRSY